MVVRSPAPVAPVRRYIDLAAHDGLYASLLGLLVELDGAIHHPVVSERDARHVLVLGKGDEVPDPARPVEHRILRMTVQVGEYPAGRNQLPPPPTSSGPGDAPDQRRPTPRSPDLSSDA